MKRVFVAILMSVLCLGGTVLAVCPSADLTGDCVVDLADFTEMAEQWLDEGISDTIGIVWVDINDPGFQGKMSKYETTNAQYCQFMNAALATGDITVSGNDVIGANGSNSGTDFVGVLYYDLVGIGYGATNGGSARIHYSGGVFRVDSGLENYPVTQISWYGATAFCNYYGYRLPTEWEWQAVADYDGSYTYGCGTSINNSIANYLGSNHPNGTTLVGAFGTYGYGMCDMAGNVFEWTNSWFEDNSRRIFRGGDWRIDAIYSKTTFRNYNVPSERGYYLGFRVVLDVN